MDYYFSPSSSSSFRIIIKLILILSLQLILLFDYNLLKCFCLKNDLKYYHYSIDNNNNNNNEGINPYSSSSLSSVSSTKFSPSNRTYFLRKKNRSRFYINNNNNNYNNETLESIKYPLNKWEPSRNRNFSSSTYQILIADGNKPLSNNNDTLIQASDSTIIYHRQPIMMNQQQQPPHPVQESIFDQPQPQLEQSLLQTYQCDSIIYDYNFIIESPDYPIQYPSNRICSYYIGRNRSDVCQIELIISDMDIEDTAQCTGDYLDLGITTIINQTAIKQPSSSSSNQQQGERLCGLMLRNTKRIINFLPNTTHIRLTFHSDSKNDRKYRGFSAEIQQLFGSCTNNNYKPGRNILINNIGGNIGYSYPQNTFNNNRYPLIINNNRYNVPQIPQYQQHRPQYPAVQPYYNNYPLTGNINTGYGQRLYPPQHPLYNNNFNYNTNNNNNNGNVNYPSIILPGSIITTTTKSIPNPQYPIQQQSIYDNRPLSNNNNNNNNTIMNGPIYLGSYCDIYIGDYQGEIRSPGYPFGYPVNHTCIYLIKKLNNNICGIELIFNHFDIQTPNTKKDLTDNCFGDYLLLPDGEQLCGYYTQSMSGDYKLKKYYEFYDTSNYIIIQFISDEKQLPDGSGFWIEIKQLNCNNNNNQNNQNTNKNNCDHIMTGQYSPVDHLYSPNYPNYYGKRQQCLYFIRPMDDKTCEYELDLIQFNLEQQQQDECKKDYLQLPNRKRICGHHKFRRIYQFPNFNERISMFYFHSDDQIEDRGYEIIIRQLPNSCDNNYNIKNNNNNTIIAGQQPLPQSFNPQQQQQPWNTNVYVPSNDPNIPTTNDGGSVNFIQPTPVFTYDNNTGNFQPYFPPSSSTFNRPGYNINDPNISNNDLGRKNIGTNYYNNYPYVSSLSSSNYWINTNNNNNLNDPRNVDHSGTIPLYYANGTLATRIPPMKPVDMIPYLKKGKTIIQKDTVGRSFIINSSNDLNAIQSNRLPISSSFNPNNSMEDLTYYQSSARLRLQPTTTPMPIPMYDFSSSSNIIKSTSSINYNCDQTIKNSIEYIRSPNFPNNYPIVTRCIYSIIKSNINVCQIRLNILSLDLEYTAGCRNDYLYIETSGEKICGHLNQPEQRLINYYGYSHDIRLIFNSDREITRKGFEIRIEQIPNSCDDDNNDEQKKKKSNLTTINSMILTLGRQFQQKLTTPAMSSSSSLVTSSPNINNNNNPIMYTNEPSYTSSLHSQDLSPQALINPSNQTSFSSTTTTTTIPNNNQQQRICKTTTSIETYFESDNFPLDYPSNINCVYKIFRSNRNVCRLEIEFEEFNVGDDYNDELIIMQKKRRRSSSSLSELSSEIINDNDNNNNNNKEKYYPLGNCINDYLEIDNQRYCGKRSGQKIAINFPKYLNEIPIYFVSTNNVTINLSKNFNGFRIKIRQIDENCRKLSITGRNFNNNNNNNNEIEYEDDFGIAIIESCPKLSKINSSSTMTKSMIMLKNFYNNNDINNNENNEQKNYYIDSSLIINEEIIKIQSPKFNLPSQQLNYNSFLDCYYVIQKFNQNICSLEIRFELFSLEQSNDCNKDYLQINNLLKFCGKLPNNTIRVFDFFDDQIILHFHTDSDQQEKGFSMILKQIRC